MILHTWFVILITIVFLVVFAMAALAADQRLNRNDRHADLLDRAAWIAAAAATFITAVYFLVQRWWGPGHAGIETMEVRAYAPMPASDAPKEMYF